MIDIISTYTDELRAVHLIAVMSWMAGLLYLPRLFVYHTEAETGSDKSETFKIMERRLYKYIMNPAMIVSWIFGTLILYAGWEYYKTQGWMHTKLLLVVLMTGAHHGLGVYVKKFAADSNTKSTKFFRILNEVPTILMVLIVVMAVVEPF